MHRDFFGLQLTYNRRLVENLPPWQNAIYFGYNVENSEIAQYFRIFASSLVKRNLLRILVKRNLLRI